MIRYILLFFIFIGFLEAADLSVKKHKYFANGFNIIVDATIKDATEARVFFKDNKSPKYQLYVKMKCTADKCYGKLPLTMGDLLAMDYIVAFKNSAGELARSPKYTSIKRDLLFLPKWQKRYLDEKVVLYTEFDPIPKYIRGIGDKLDIKTTSEDNIWGIKLNLYDAVKENKCDCCDQCKDGSSFDLDTSGISTKNSSLGF